MFQFNDDILSYDQGKQKNFVLLTTITINIWKIGACVNKLTQTPSRDKTNKKAHIPILSRSKFCSIRVFYPPQSPRNRGEI